MTPDEGLALVQVGEAVVDGFWAWHDARENHARIEGIEW